MEKVYADYDTGRCLNCGAQLAAQTRFCPCCGQRNRAKNLPLWDWITEGLSNFFHLEGKTLTTLRDLFVPGRITHRYLSGKRQAYLHPLRTLLLSSLLLIAALQLVDDEENKTFFTITSESTEPTTLALDSLKNQMLYWNQLQARYYTFLALRSAFEETSDTTSPIYRQYRDKFYNWASSESNIQKFTIDNSEVSIPFHALMLLPEDELLDKYAPDFSTRIVAKRALTFTKEGREGLMRRIFKNFTLLILLITPVSAGIYWLLYRRQLPYYTQHLVHTSYLSSAAILLLTLLVLLKIGEVAPEIILTGFGLLAIFLLASDQRVYQLSFGQMLWRESLVAFLSLLAAAILAALWFFMLFLFL